MLYTTLGRTNRKVSRIGFGGCPAGVKNYVETYDPGKTDDYGEGVRAARRAYELGINYFDTAPGYGNGLSEQIIQIGCRVDRMRCSGHRHGAAFPRDHPHSVS